MNLWLAFVAASTALLLSPGPTVLLVLSYALSQGRRVALATAAGVAFGDFIAMSASLAGLGALILASSTIFIVLKWVGAAYLVYLGVKLLKSAGSGVSLGQSQTDAPLPGAVFRHTATVTALNPKSIIFFIAFVPQFVATDMALMPQFIILIATFVGLATLNVLVYALLADKLRRQIARPAVIGWLTRGGGVAMIALGCATAAMRRS